MQTSMSKRKFVVDDQNMWNENMTANFDCQGLKCLQRKKKEIHSKVYMKLDEGKKGTKM